MSHEEEKDCCDVQSGPHYYYYCRRPQRTLNCMQGHAIKHATIVRDDCIIRHSTLSRMSRTISVRKFGVPACASFHLRRTASSCPNLHSLGLVSPTHHTSPRIPLGTTMNIPRNAQSSPPTMVAGGGDNDKRNNKNPLQAIREQMMRNEHKYAQSYTQQEPLLPPPPPFGDTAVARQNDEINTSDDSHPHMRQPQDTLRSLLFSSTTSRSEVSVLTPRTSPVPSGRNSSHLRVGDWLQPPPGPTPRTPGRRHAALATDAVWNRTPPRFFPRGTNALDAILETASQEVTKKLRTETGSVATMNAPPSSPVRMRPRFEDGHVLRTLARALAVPTSRENIAYKIVEPPGPPPLYVEASTGKHTTCNPGKNVAPARASSDITDFPNIDFASLGIAPTLESKLAGSSSPQRIVRSDPERRRPRRRMSAPSA